MLNWSRNQLTEGAGFSRATIADFERGEPTPSQGNILAIRTAFEMARLEFIAENGGGVSARCQQSGERSSH